MESESEDNSPPPEDSDEKEVKSERKKITRTAPRKISSRRCTMKPPKLDANQIEDLEAVSKIGALVWARVGRKYWPGVVEPCSNATPAVGSKKPGHLLVHFTEEGGPFAWVKPEHMKPFVKYFHKFELTQKTGFFVRAVLKALDSVPEFQPFGWSETAPPPEPEDHNNTYCEVCGKPGKLLCCDKCPRAFHFRCLNLKESDLGDDEEWLCPPCKGESLPRVFTDTHPPPVFKLTERQQILLLEAESAAERKQAGEEEEEDEEDDDDDEEEEEEKDATAWVDKAIPKREKVDNEAATGGKQRKSGGKAKAKKNAKGGAHDNSNNHEEEEGEAAAEDEEHEKESGTKRKRKENKDKNKKIKEEQHDEDAMKDSAESEAATAAPVATTPGKRTPKKPMKFQDIEPEPKPARVTKKNNNNNKKNNNNVPWEDSKGIFLSSPLNAPFVPPGAAAAGGGGGGGGGTIATDGLEAIAAAAQAVAEAEGGEIPGSAKKAKGRRIGSKNKNPSKKREKKNAAGEIIDVDDEDGDEDDGEDEQGHEMNDNSNNNKHHPDTKNRNDDAHNRSASSSTTTATEKQYERSNSSSSINSKNNDHARAVKREGSDRDLAKNSRPEQQKSSNSQQQQQQQQQPPAQPHPDEKPCTTVAVFGLPPHCTERKLTEFLFTWKILGYKSCRVRPDRGIAFIDFRSIAESAAALPQLDGRCMEGAVLRAHYSRTTTLHGGGSYPHPANSSSASYNNADRSDDRANPNVKRESDGDRSRDGWDRGRDRGDRGGGGGGGGYDRRGRDGGSWDNNNGRNNRDWDRDRERDSSRDRNREREWQNDRDFGYRRKWERKDRESPAELSYAAHLPPQKRDDTLAPAAAAAAPVAPFYPSVDPRVAAHHQHHSQHPSIQQQLHHHHHHHQQQQHHPSSHHAHSETSSTAISTPSLSNVLPTPPAFEPLLDLATATTAAGASAAPTPVPFIASTPMPPVPRAMPMTGENIPTADLMASVNDVKSILEKLRKQVVGDMAATTNVDPSASGAAAATASSSSEPAQISTALSLAPAGAPPVAPSPLAANPLASIFGGGPIFLGSTQLSQLATLVQQQVAARSAAMYSTPAPPPPPPPTHPTYHLPQHQPPPPPHPPPHYQTASPMYPGAYGMGYPHPHNSPYGNWAPR